MIVFPNCKINLGLRILRKRSDGYHDLETVFYPLPITDILEIIRYPVYQKIFTVPLSKSGFVIDGDPSENLCVKAFKLLKRDFPRLPNVQMHLHKSIPAGAGLGGGSADGAFTLQVLNKEFELGLSVEELQHYALKLGSDCPFFIVNKPCYASGRGEILEPVELDLSAYNLVIVNPGISINTGRAFLHIRPAIPEISIKEIIKQPLERWKDELVNDFESWVFKSYPSIVEIKDQLYVAGALYASMSGSGSTVFGIFARDHIPELNFPPDYFVRTLAGQFK
ncbi:MAG TPA: 4-(cytidine 5'-diphospho)-2-C-methyl-D-erythritol kinase [Chitinophagaceae bacterium]|nr:4-(cytidine 5'-diphospho)-2-C-methyl-D-erythritol kinase [Chitinophagaceae bacterium]